MGGRNGLADWKLQRVTALYMFFYMVGLAIVLYRMAPLTYDLWVQLFHKPLMQISTLLVLVAALYHTWIGLWIIATDYMPKVAIRMSFYLLVIFALSYYLIWGIKIVWGI